MALNYVTITETFKDGTGKLVPSGSVTFAPSQTIYVPSIGQLSPGTPIGAQIVNGALLAADGVSALQILATDNTGVTVEGQTGFWFWTVTITIAGVVQPAWSFFLAHTPATQDLYTLASTPASGTGITLPAGDLGGSNAVPTVINTHLAATFTFGASGAVPASGTFIAGQILVDQAGVIRVCLTGGTPGTWARAGQKAWEFYVDDYGAKGDGKEFLGGAGTSGTNTFSDTTNAPFVSGDTGKVIVANQGTGGGNITTPFTGTITYVSASSVTLSANLIAAASNCPYIYGTDDAAAITNCVNAAAAYSVSSGNPEVDIVFSSRFYMLAALTQSKTGVSGAVLTYNTHVPVPVALQVAQSLVVNLRAAGGAATAPGSQYWEDTIPGLAGTSLVSAITPPAQPDANFGQMSVIGGPSTGDSAHFAAGGFANVQINSIGITYVAPWLSQITGVDGYHARQMDVPDGRAISFVPVNLQQAAVGGPWLGNLTSVQTPANDVAVGFKFPTSLNNANSFAGRIATAGFSVGVQAGEHMSAQELTLLYADQGYKVDMQGFGPVTHGHTIGKLTVENSNHGIMVVNGGAGQAVPFFVGLLDMENVYLDHINDPTNSLNGFVYVSNTTATRPVIVGGAQLIAVDTVKHGPGPWSGAPAAPATGVAQQNTSYRYTTITLSATTITSVQVGPPRGDAAPTLTTLVGKTQASGGPAIDIAVAPGGWWLANYTGTLTATWNNQ